MPFIAHTPESLLPRSDSKNPATTCRGITSTGRPCRRALASPSGSPSRGSPTLIPGRRNHVVPGNVEDLFCWQHKDQAQRVTESQVRMDAVEEEGMTLKGRSSIDTLVERLGVLNVSGKRRNGRSDRPIMEKTGSSHDRMGGSKSNRSSNAPRRRRRPSGLALLCCLGSVHERDEDVMPPARYSRPQNGPSAQQNTPSRPEMSASYGPQPSTPTSGRRNPNSSLSPIRDASPASNMGPTGSPLSSAPHTPTLLSLIPPNLNPATASQLLAELAKPISPYDEDGFIYIFWLTPGSEDSSQRDLDVPVTAARPRRLSELVQESSPRSSPARTARDTGARPAKKPKTILLKIGRANNVHRRMNEWSRQCGYDLQLVRWYPYISSSSPSPSPSGPRSRAQSSSSRPPARSSASAQTPRKVPHAHKVERLIHIELAERRVTSGECKTCGRIHREWFEIEATEGGVRGIDEVVRRWVAWGENGAVTAA